MGWFAKDMAGNCDRLTRKIKTMKSVVVEAVGAAITKRNTSSFGSVMEEAMTNAVLEAYAEGISEDDEIKKRKLKIRAKLRREAAQ